MPAQKPSPTFDLDRFKRAQEQTIDGLDTALGELKRGQKQSHWIWYIFPQLAGLGRSPMAVEYGLRGVAEATAYLQDPALRQRLVLVVTAIAEQLSRRPPPPLRRLMGSEIDALKLVSSMTLFGEIARRLEASTPAPDVRDLAEQADVILRAAAAEGHAPCQETLRQLGP
jgi:uncharacterized protein (DUF1810 family)